MRVRNRAATVLVALTLLAAACGGDDSDEAAGPSGTDRPTSQPAPQLPECPIDALDGVDEPVEVVVWHSQTARPVQVLDQLVAEYNSSQDRVRVRLESQGADYQELQRRFNEALPSQQLPALILVDDTFTQSMADSGVVLPAQSCFDAADIDLSQFAEGAVSYFSVDGVLWPASMGLGSVVLFYNRGHFEAAGLDPDRTPRTLAELREYAEKLAAAGVSERPLAHELSSWKHEFWLTGAGSPVVGNDNGRGSGTTDAATLERNPEAQELFEWLAQMETDELMQAVPSTPGQIDQFLALASERSSMLVESSFAATSVEAFLAGSLDPDDVGAGADAVDVGGLDISAGPFPGMRGPGETQMGGATWYLLNTHPDEVIAAAWDFTQFLNTGYAQSRLLIEGSFLPWLERANEDPQVLEYYNGDGGLAGRWLAIARDHIDAVDPDFPGPLIGPYDEFRTEMETALDELLFAGASPSAALSSAHAAITRALERYEEANF